MLTEIEIINALKKHGKVFSENVIASIGDDAAFLLHGKAKKKYALFTTDQLVEGVHFSWKWCTSSDVAYKLVQMNLSDILAKGGEPTMALLNLQLSRSFVKDENKAKSFARQLGRSLKKYRITLLGGDTTSSEIDSFTLTLLGECDYLRLRKSDRLEEGDLLLLYGEVGGSSYALSRLIRKHKVSARVKRYYTRPEAKPEAAVILNRLEAKISMDVSDSLHESMTLLSNLNHVHIRVDIDQIPHPKELQKLDIGQKINHILAGGEDFSIVFSASKKDEKKVKKICDKNRSLKIIGKFISASKTGMVEYFLDGEKVNPVVKNFRHFS